MTAIGLAIVALAFNQSWPLIPGSAIPSLPPKRQTVGPAAVVASPVVRSANLGVGPARPGRSHVRSQHASTTPSGGAAAGANEPPATVVSQSTPVTSPPGAQQDQSSSQGHAPPVPRHGAEAPTTVAAAPSTPEATPAPAPSHATETSRPASTPPVAATVEPPEESESNLPPWSNGNGHAYGGEEGWHGHDEDEEGSHGHGWGDEG